MRKVSSAPALLDLKSDQSSVQQPRPQNCLATGFRRKDGNPNAKARNISAGSLPSLLPQQAIIPPGLEEFSESARGLAGLDCYEKFGKQMHSAPSLQDWEDEVLVGRARVAQEVQQDEDDQALASCLATPYAADERNLGEQVEAAARARLQANEEELSGRVASSIETSRGNAVTTMEQVDTRPGVPRRRRRLLESLGLHEEPPWAGESSGFSGNALAQQYLAQQAAIEALNNRLFLPPEWACNDDICHPVIRADQRIFAHGMTVDRQTGMVDD